MHRVIEATDNRRPGQPATLVLCGRPSWLPFLFVTPCDEQMIFVARGGRRGGSIAKLSKKLPIFK
jgi:hypothetical protein